MTGASTRLGKYLLLPHDRETTRPKETDSQGLRQPSSLIKAASASPSSVEYLATWNTGHQHLGMNISHRGAWGPALLEGSLDNQNRVFLNGVSPAHRLLHIPLHVPIPHTQGEQVHRGG